MRGWSYSEVLSKLDALICPAYAGMIPIFFHEEFVRSDLSRVCGDDPGSPYLYILIFAFVPRMRGWSYYKYFGCATNRICPAYAGMIPGAARSTAATIYLSRVCGDDPIKNSTCRAFGLFVPRMRGWSLIKMVLIVLVFICPAYAGMILCAVELWERGNDLSRVCGDDPYALEELNNEYKFVPRMRGWSWVKLFITLKSSICPAYAGMILLSSGT